MQQGQNVGLELPSPQGSHLLRAWVRSPGKGRGLMGPTFASWAPYVKILCQNWQLVTHNPWQGCAGTVILVNLCNTELAKPPEIHISALPWCYSPHPWTTETQRKHLTSLAGDLLQELPSPAAPQGTWGDLVKMVISLRPLILTLAAQLSTRVTAWVAHKGLCSSTNTSRGHVLKCEANPQQPFKETSQASAFQPLKGLRWLSTCRKKKKLMKVHLELS